MKSLLQFALRPKQLKVLLTGALCAFAGGTLVMAQNAPAGAIDDLGAVGGPTPSAYAFFTTTFTASEGYTTVNFAFRETPAFFSLDDVTVAATGSTTNLVADPGFESSTVGTNYPDQWGAGSNC